MPCHIVKFPGGHAIVKTAAPRSRKCSVCGDAQSDYRLCDGYVGRGKTCNAVLCPLCTTSGPKDTDYCPLHVRQADGKLRL